MKMDISGLGKLMRIRDDDEGVVYLNLFAIPAMVFTKHFTITVLSLSHSSPVYSHVLPLAY